MPKLLKIPTLKYIYDNFDKFEIRHYESLYLIKVTQNIYGGPGAWYRYDIDEIFLTKEFNNKQHQVIACLTKLVRPPDWSYHLSGWVIDGDCIKYSKPPLDIDNKDIESWCESKLTINRFSL